MKTRFLLVVYLAFSALFGCDCGGRATETTEVSCHSDSECARHCVGAASYTCETVCVCRYVERADAGTDAPDSGSPDASSADASVADAGVVNDDAGFMHADAGRDGGVPSVDAGSGDAGTADAGPPIIIRITKLDTEPVQIITDVTVSQNLGLSRFSICAIGGQVHMTSVTTYMDGMFGDMPVTTRIGSRPESVRNLMAGQESVLQLFDQPEVLQDGACSELRFATTLPIANQWTRWVRPRVTNMSALESVRVVYGNNNETFTFGLRTVFRPEPGLVVSAINTPNPEVLVARTAENTMVGLFRVCTEPYQTATVDEVSIEVTTGQPSTVSFPLRMYVTFGDSDQQWWNLSTTNEVVSEGDVMTWHANRPDGQPENLSYGGCLGFQLDLTFVPTGATKLKVALRSVSTSVPVEARNQQGQTRLFPTLPPFSPEPWALIRFADPVPTPPFMLFNWQGPRNLNLANWYLWTGEPTVCWRNGIEGGVQEECPLLHLTGQVMGIDRRFPAELKSVTLGTLLEGLPAGLTVRVEVEKGFNIRTPLLTREVIIGSGDSEILLTLNATLTNADDFGVRVRVFLVSSLPQEDAALFVAPRLRYDLRSVVATWVEEPLVPYLNAPEVPGQWNWMFRPLPYQGPGLVFHSPEIWLESNMQGAPLALSMSAPVQESTVLNSVFRLRYGESEICELRFTHGTGKENPVAENISAQVAGTVLLMFEWTQNEVVFRAPPGQCVWIPAMSNFQLNVKIGHPIEPTLDGFPLQFKLFRMIAHPARMNAPDVPVITEIRNGHKVLLSDEEAVAGVPVIIMP